jgi:two-component system alkaline phosphatase synthesis response regulator PhoP
VKKILIIDDSDTFQETTKAVLMSANYEVITASNGKEGLEKIYAESPDMVLLDCVMPEIDGFEVVKSMREDPLLANKPVIMVTGKDTEYDEIKGLALGIDDYIVKPFNPSVLIARVNAILGRKEQSISANPLTFLSGNTIIRSEAEKRLNEQKVFAMI